MRKRKEKKSREGDKNTKWKQMRNGCGVDKIKARKVKWFR